MNVLSLVVGPIESNCHILFTEDRQALVVDPGGDADRILQSIESEQLTVIGYPLTHGHFDHIAALADVYRKHPAPVGLHPADAAWAFTDANQFPPYYPTPEAPPTIERAYADGQVWTDGGMTYRVLTTPGHSPGGVCFYFESDQVLIAGDTLFRGSIGRTDLPGANPQDMVASLSRLKELPRDVDVYTGHGPATRIGQELDNNPFLQGAR